MAKKSKVKEETKIVEPIKVIPVKVEAPVIKKAAASTAKVFVTTTQDVTIPNVISIITGETQQFDREEWIQKSNKSVLLRTLINNRIVIVKKV